jgi:hypothetical protein
MLDISCHERKKRISSCGQAAILNVIRKQSHQSTDLSQKTISEENRRVSHRTIPENLQSVGMILKSRRSCRRSENSVIDLENKPIDRVELPTTLELAERKEDAPTETTHDSGESSLPDISDQDVSHSSIST